MTMAIGIITIIVFAAALSTGICLVILGADLLEATEGILEALRDNQGDVNGKEGEDGTKEAD
jgi:hypothetical protein